MSRIEMAIEKATALRNAAASEAGRQKPLLQPKLSKPPQQDELRLKPQSCLLATLNDPHSAVAEEYRKLKSIVVKLTNGDEFKNVLMVTSTVASEGKSITALNLAITMAQEFDHTVLLIDADLRKPSIHRYLEIKPTVGFADCLVDDIDIGEAIITTGIGKLSIIPAGREVKNPLELFSSQKMRDMVADIKNRYHDRYVIFDTPPFLPFAETYSLSQLVDGIVFVVKEGSAAKEDVQEALAALQKSNVLGVVFNEATIGGLGSHYDSYYRYGKNS
jgi:protein-tyrosine kinase